MINHASVVIHVNKDLCKMSVESLQGEMRRLPGVQEVRMGSGNTSHHMVVVQFDSEKISSQQLLEHLTNQGMEAQLLGM